jgi:UDP-N-acetylmuramate dehydrogenase
MVRIRENVSLRSLNTFGIDVKARHFIDVSSENDLRDLINLPIYRQSKVLILGGGSNVLFTGDFDGLVIKSGIIGKEVVHTNDHTLLLKSGSGESWHDLVMHAVMNNWGGIENLSLIPGTAGAAPMQNIGAYGVEIKDVIENVDAIDLSTGELRTFNNAECRFSYRESIFKHDLKEKYFISSITLRLTRNDHQLNTSYGAIQDVLKARSIVHPTIKDISDAVINIRQSKLPDPRLIGNAGSFFKNPTINSQVFEALKKAYPTIPSYPSDNQSIKVPAGWLIEQCGWKGKRLGNIGVHQHQALVLVNYGGGNGKEIFDLAMNISKSVQEKFNITLTTEVNVI